MDNVELREGCSLFKGVHNRSGNIEGRGNHETRRDTDKRRENTYPYILNNIVPEVKGAIFLRHEIEEQCTDCNFSEKPNH